jgi:hypothetical protein
MTGLQAGYDFPFEAGEEEELFVVETAEEFAAVDEPGAEPLVLAGDGTVIPVDGLMLAYGREGAGKTTVAIDWAVHWAAGSSWLGIFEPSRPLQVLIVENEGPRNEFRRKLRRRLAAWSGPEPGRRLVVLRDPWACVSLRDETHRAKIANLIKANELDLVIMGPLFSLGMVGGGTADEITEFVTLLADVRKRAERRVSFLIVHQENRAGQVSGAWGPRPDTLVHVQQQGHGQLRVFWEKARWASALHGTGTSLVWADGETFEAVEREPVTEERVWEDIAAFVLANGGCSWNKVVDAVSGKSKLKMQVRDRLLETGVLKNVPKGRAFFLWHRDDPASAFVEIPTGESLRESPDSTPAGGEPRGRDSLIPSCKEESGKGISTSPPTGPLADRQELLDDGEAEWGQP